MPPQRLQAGTVPLIGCSVTVGVDAANGNGTGRRLPVHIEEGHTALGPIAPMPVGVTVGLTRAVVPVALNVEFWPVEDGGQFTARHAVEACQPFLAAIGNDTR